MKKLFSFWLFLIAFFLISPTLVSAHILKTDGSVGAVIHIDPEDDPIIGEPANFFFEFKDTDNKFNTQDCACIATISRDDQVLTTQSLASNSSLTSSSFSYTFPEKGVYKIEISGQPNSGASFENFTLTYDLRVERTDSKQPLLGSNFLEENFHFLALGIILIIFLAITFLGKRKTKNTNLKGTGLSCLVITFTLVLTFQFVQGREFLASHPHGQENYTHTSHLPCCSNPPSNKAVNLVEVYSPSETSEQTVISPFFFLEKHFNYTLSRSPPLFS